MESGGPKLAKTIWYRLEQPYPGPRQVHQQNSKLLSDFCWFSEIFEFSETLALAPKNQETLEKTS